MSYLIFEISPSKVKFSQKLNCTLKETAKLIASHGLAMPHKAVCSALSSSVWQALRQRSL